MSSAKKKARPGFRIDKKTGKQVVETRGRKKMPGARRLAIPTSVSTVEKIEVESLASNLGVERSELMYSFFREGIEKLRSGALKAQGVVPPRRPMIYLSVPLNAETTPYETEQLQHAAAQAATEAWRMGCVVVAPRLVQNRWIGAVPPEILEEGTRVILHKCDAVLMPTGWKSSELSMAERAQAELAGIPTFVGVAKLAAWLAQNDVERPAAAR